MVGIRCGLWPIRMSNPMIDTFKIGDVTSGSVLGNEDSQVNDWYDEYDSLFVSPSRRKSQIDEACSNILGSIRLETDGNEDRDKTAANIDNFAMGTRKLSLSFQEQ